MEAMIDLVIFREKRNGKDILPFRIRIFEERSKQVVKEISDLREKEKFDTELRGQIAFS